MAYSKNTGSKTTWVSVPVDDAVHGEVRVHALRQRKGLPAVVEEAMKLWLAAQNGTAA